MNPITDQSLLESVVQTMIEDFWFTLGFYNLGIDRTSDDGVKITNALTATFMNRAEYLLKGLV